MKKLMFITLGPAEGCQLQSEVLWRNDGYRP